MRLLVLGVVFLLGSGCGNGMEAKSVFSEKGVECELIEYGMYLHAFRTAEWGDWKFVEKKPFCLEGYLRDHPEVELVSFALNNRSDIVFATRPKTPTCVCEK